MVTSRIWFTATQKAELWERWKSGLSVAAISRALDRRNKTGVLRIVTLHGGIAPARRRRALAALRLEEREEISRGFVPRASIDRLYWDMPYHLVPAGKTGIEAYAVIRAAMAKQNMVATGRLVMSTRERICAIEIEEGGLVLTTCARLG